jgi:Bifunctional DNA primase/polymerase, N-terminal
MSEAAKDAATSEMLVAALGYAAAGWTLVPLVAGTKRPHVKTGADHAQAATCDADRVHDWWTRWPDAGIGIVCAAGGFLVVDVDGEEGRQSFLAHPGPFPATCCSASGREGYGCHWWYRVPLRTGMPRGRVLAPGLERKAAGNLVVAPPSLHRSGRRYSWDVSPERVAPQPPAAWMLEKPTREPPRPIERAATALDGRSYTAEGAARFDGVLRVVEKGQGARHPRLVWAALRARELADAGHLAKTFAVTELRRTAAAVWNGEDDRNEIESVLTWAQLT